MRSLTAFVLASAIGAPIVAAQVTPCSGSCVRSGEIYIAYYWKARPGREAEYEDYIRKVARPIDDEAQHAGAFEELRTYVPDTPNGDWTHLRVFRLKDQAQLDAFPTRMDDAGKRIYPDSSKRPKADDLRDLVKRETWHGFRFQ